MKISALHHVSLVSTDIGRSSAFYSEMLGFKVIARPSFKIGGAWLASGPVEIHLIDNPQGTFRDSASIDTGDVHFALRVDDFEQTMSDLAAKGFRTDAAPSDPMRIHINRKSIAGYPQAYLLDPDRNIIEINAAAL